MALKNPSLVHEVSTAGFGGTGPVQLGGTPTTVTGRISFANGVGNGNAVEYIIRDAAGAWERVIGTLTTGAPDTLSRDTVLENSLGTTALVNFAAGTKDVYAVGPRAVRLVLAKTANYTAVLADFGRLIDGTGTWTLAFAAAATLGNGWEVELRNSGAGTITLDPNGAELIDGAATIAAGPGEAFKIKCDGTGFKTVGRTVLGPITGRLVAGTPLVLNPYTGGSSTVQAHGLGVVPKFVGVAMECLSANLGYSAGDVIEVLPGTGGTTASNIFISGMSIVKDATNLTLITSSVPPIPNKSTFSLGTQITASSWKITLTPYALT